MGRGGLRLNARKIRLPPLPTSPPEGGGEDFLGASAPRRQLDDGGAGRRGLVAMRESLLADLDQMLAVLDELAGDAAVNDDHVAVRIVAADLAAGLPKEA